MQQKHSRIHILLHIKVLRHRQQRVAAHARKAALIEREDLHLEALVLAHNLLRVLVRVERVHQHQRYVRLVLLVQALDLLHRQIQKRQVRTHRDHTFRPVAAHRRAQAAVQLDHHQLVQHGADLLVAGRSLQRFVVLDRVAGQLLDFLPVHRGSLLLQETAEQSRETLHLAVGEFRLLRAGRHRADQSLQLLLHLGLCVTFGHLVEFLGIGRDTLVAAGLQIVGHNTERVTCGHLEWLIKHIQS